MDTLPEPHSSLILLLPVNTESNLVCLVYSPKKVLFLIPQSPGVLCGSVFLGRSGPEAVRLLL